MGMAQPVHHWMPDDVRELPDDGRRYECIDGVLLVTPSPRRVHQRALREMVRRLLPFVDAERVGELLWSPADLELAPGSLVQPDLFVLALSPAAAAADDWGSVRGLRLAVEVLSSSTAAYDRGLKREFYQRAPVEEYWIVDVEARLVERWRAGDERPEVARRTLVWHPTGAAGALTIDVEEYFAAVEGGAAGAI
jgi:Uma2 family endonuclease